MKVNTVVSGASLALAAGALAFSVTHHGPRGLTGPQGPQGPKGVQGAAASAAKLGPLGVCVSQNIDSTTGDLLTYSVESPTYVNGVPSCPSGQFVSIQVQHASTTAGTQG